MAKFSIPFQDEPPPRPRSPRARLLLLLVPLAPFVYEGVVVCVARWMALFGQGGVVRTPALNWLGDQSLSALRSFNSVFTDGRWSTRNVLAIGLACFVFCGYMLRKK